MVGMASAWPFGPKPVRAYASAGYSTVRAYALRLLPWLGRPGDNLGPDGPTIIPTLSWCGGSPGYPQARIYPLTANLKRYFSVFIRLLSGCYCLFSLYLPCVVPTVIPEKLNFTVDGYRKSLIIARN